MTAPLAYFFRKKGLKKYGSTIKTGMIPLTSVQDVTVLLDSADRHMESSVKLINDFFRNAGVKPDIIYIDTRNKKARKKGAATDPIMTFERKDLKRLAAIAPHCTLNIIRDGRVAEKYRTHMPPRIYNFDDLCCQNEACISNPVNGEGVPASFYRTPDGHFACAYCGRFHTFKEIWKKRS